MLLFLSKKWFRTIIISLVSFVIIYLIFQKINYQHVLTVVINGDPWWLLLGLLCLFCIHFIFPYRWQIGLRLLGYEVQYSKLLKIYLANLPFSKITPAYSGDFLRSFHLKKDIPMSYGAGLILFEGIFDIFILLCCSLMFGLFIAQYTVVYISTFLLFILFIFFIFASLLPKKYFGKYKNKLENFFYIFDLFIKKPKKFITIMILSIVMALLLFVFFKITFYAYGESVSLFLIAALYPLVNIISLLPVTVWGIGVRESAMVYLFSHFVAVENILATSLTFSVLGIAIFPLFCLPFSYVLMDNFLKKSKNK